MVLQRLEVPQRPSQQINKRNRLQVAWHVQSHGRAFEALEHVAGTRRWGSQPGTLSNKSAGGVSSQSRRSQEFAALAILA